MMPTFHSLIVKWLVLSLACLGGAVLIVFLLYWLLDPFSRHRHPEFPFHHSGGDGKVSIFSVHASGDLVEHDACVVSAYPTPLRKDPVGYWARHIFNDPVLYEHVRETPFLYYEFDVGSGVGTYCVHSITDPELAGRIAAVMSSQCRPLADLPLDNLRDPSLILGLSEFKDSAGETCSEPGHVTYQLR